MPFGMAAGLPYRRICISGNLGKQRLLSAETR